MSQVLLSPSACCSPCDESVNVAIPGPQGEPGTNGSNGTNGLNAFAQLTDQFTVPNAGAPDIAEVDNSDWAVVGQIVFLEGAGYFDVASIPDATHIELDNTDYTGNAPDGTIIPIASHLSPGGIKGTDGSNGTGDMLGANNLSDVASPSASVTNLGGSVVGAAVFGVASPSAIRFFRVNADNTVALLSDSDTRIALGLVIGTNVQAFDTQLQALSQAVSAADAVPYFTGAGPNDIAVFTATSVGRSLMAQATAALMLTALGKVLPRQGFLAKLTAVNMNVTADTSMGIVATRFRVTAVIVESATATLATAPCTGGLFKTAGGLNPICADQTLAACVLPINFASLTIGGIGLTDLFTADLIFRVGTPAGFAATANVWVFGEDLS